MVKALLPAAIGYELKCPNAKACWSLENPKLDDTLSKMCPILLLYKCIFLIGLNNGSATYMGFHISL